MNLRALSLVGLVALSLSAVACSAESTDGTTSEDNEIRARSSAGLTTEKLQSELAKAVEGIEWTSESDYPLDVMVAPGQLGAAVDADAIRASFASAPLWAQSFDSLKLSDLKGAKERGFDEWMDVSDIDESDEYSVAFAKGITKASELMKSNLTDLKVVLMAEDSLENSEDVGFLHCFIVGRAKDGSLVALHTGLVWT